MKLKLEIILILFTVFVLSNRICAQYVIKNSVMGIGGQTLSDSLNYKIYGTAGQSFIGESENNSNIHKAGFWYISGDGLTNLDNPFDNLPAKFELYQNYPNPFNPLTTIKFALPITLQVRIDVFNVLGQRMLTVLNEKKAAGLHTITLNANQLASGIYFYTINAKNFYEIKKMVLVK